MTLKIPLLKFVFGILLNAKHQGKVVKVCSSVRFTHGLMKKQRVWKEASLREPDTETQWILEHGFELPSPLIHEIFQ